MDDKLTSLRSLSAISRNSGRGSAAMAWRMKMLFGCAETLSAALWNDESGQDLIEYTLLMAFVALTSAALFVNTGGSVSKVWSTSNSTLSHAAAIAAS
jgi:Flp pilus assembly pilin Flp